LKKALHNRENFNLIIDEAHKLSFDLLEEIRLLSNMETGDDKLINIFLVGQPELNEKLSDPRCRPLLQRISIRHHIRPLNLEETREYMATRLKVAGAKKGNQIFSKKAVEAIYDFSRGYPREINILADNALLLGYSRGRKKITPSMIKQCYEDMQLVGTPVQTKVPEPKQKETNKTHHLPSKRQWKWAAVLFFFLAFTVMGTTPLGKEIIWRFNALISSTYQAAVAKIAETSQLEKTETQLEIPNMPDVDSIEIQKAPSHKIENHKIERAKIQEQSADVTVEKKTEAVEVRKVPIGTNKDSKLMETTSTKLAKPLEAEFPMREKVKEPSRVVIVGRGDTLSGLTRRIYGKTSDEIIAMVKAANPDLKSINFIKSGQRIVFPQVQKFGKTTTFTVHVASYKLYEPAFSMYRGLLENGYDVYILPKDDPQKGRIFRVTVGYFKSRKEAQGNARILVKQGISTYANPIEVEIK
jgi:cell division septation protein DedD